MAAEAKDSSGAARGPQRPRPTQPGLRLLHALLLVGAGGWLLLRALQTLRPQAALPATLGFAPASAAVGAWAVAALLLGAALLGAALMLPYGRAGAWAAAALLALLALIVAAGAWAAGLGADWLGVALAGAAIVALSAPRARETYLA